MQTPPPNLPSYLPIAPSAQSHYHAVATVVEVIFASIGLFGVGWLYGALHGGKRIGVGVALLAISPAWFFVAICAILLSGGIAALGVIPLNILFVFGDFMLLDNVQRRP